MNEATVLDVSALLQPVSSDRPGGEDVTFEPVFDEIRDARTQDDPTLAAGEWSRELKVADWPRVRDLATRTLAEQSKHLQVACWLTESLGHLHGFAGIRAGLEVHAGLLREHWDDLHPAADDGDLEPRANSLSWLNSNIGRLVRSRPLTSDGRSWFDWKTSLEVDNAERRDASAKAALLAEGKIDGETWRKLVAATPDEDFTRHHADLRGLREAFEALESEIDRRFGSDAPGLGELEQAVVEVQRLVDGIAAERGVAAGADATPAASAVSEEAPAVAPTSDASAAAASGEAPGLPAGSPPSRQEALKRLREIADFFRRTEPHSPVAYMLDRAVKWANMPLDLWLQEVVKDPHVLSTLNETLGVDRGGDRGGE